MDFAPTEEQCLLQDSVRRYLDKEYSFELRRSVAETRGGFDRQQWAQFAQMGWLGVALPEAVGGSGGSAVEGAIMLQEFGRALVLEPFIAFGVLAAQTILNAGTQAQRSRFLPSLIAGESLMAPACNEHEAKGRLDHVATRAKAHGGNRYLITGGKSLVLGGPVADRYLVSARISGAENDPEGMALFVLQGDAKGLHRNDYRLIDGTPASDLVFEDVEVTSADRLGDGADVFAALELAHDHALVATCAEAVGVMEQAIRTTRDYLLERDQFGVVLASFQALQHRLADMVIALEQSRAMLHCALSSLDSNDAAARRLAVAAAKAQIGNAGKFIGAQAIQLHGGIGMTNEYRIGHCFKRLLVIEACLGNTQLHLREIARRYVADEQRTACESGFGCAAGATSGWSPTHTT